MTSPETPKDPASRVTDMSDDMRRKITTCYAGIVQESLQEKQSETAAIICLMAQRVIQSAERIIRSANTNTEER